MVTKEARIEAIKVLIAEGWNPPLPDERVMDRMAETFEHINRYTTSEAATPAELKVLQAAAQGYSTRTTAMILGLTMYTIADQRKAAIRRLGARNTTNAVAIAVRKELITI